MYPPAQAPKMTILDTEGGGGDFYKFEENVEIAKIVEEVTFDCIAIEL